MKKWIAFLCFMSTLVFIVCSCGQNKTKEGYLEFPKLQWGMTMEEVKEVLEIEEENISHEMIGQMATSIRVENESEKIFGEKYNRLFLEFIDFGDGIRKLCSVSVQYERKSADMDQVIKNMEKEYGETVSSITEYSTFNALKVDGKQEFTENTVEETDNIKLWKGISMGEILEKVQYETYRKTWGNYQDGFDEELWESFLKNASVTIVFDNRDADYPTISWNAYNYCVYDFIKEQNL